MLVCPPQSLKVAYASLSLSVVSVILTPLAARSWLTCGPRWVETALTAVDLFVVARV